MKRLHNYLGMAGFVALVGVVSAVTTAPVIAQAVMKAALVRNVDEPGRVPYAREIVSSCNNTFCFSAFPQVPNGKRLVIEYVAGIVRPTSPTGVASYAEMTTSGTPNAVQQILPMTRFARAGASNVYDTWGFAQPVRAFVNAGESASVTMAQEVGGPVGFASVTITGYLVDVNP